MSPDDLFQGASTAALAGWIILLASPLAPVWSARLAGLAIPLVLSVAYTGLVLAFFSGAEGGFGSLPEVMSLFTQPEIALAGWIHFLAFDLFVGAWIVRRAREDGVWFAFVIPCLGLTFMFGPAGYLAYSGLRLARAGYLKGRS
ncbi:MAG: ABA4-like family protein [Pseudomonadota bacterium]